MSERLLNPYKRGILLKLKSAYKGIWKELYPIFEMYQYLIQLEDYLILKLKDPDDINTLSSSFDTFLKEFKRYYQIPDELDYSGIKRFIHLIDEALSKIEIEEKAYFLKIGSHPKFKQVLKDVESFISLVFKLNKIYYITIPKNTNKGFIYNEFKSVNQNLEIDSDEIIKQQIEMNFKIKEFRELEVLKYIRDNNLTLNTIVEDGQEYKVLNDLENKVDSVYTSDNIKHSSLQRAIRHNNFKKQVNENFSKIKLVDDKLMYQNRIFGVVDRVQDVEDRILSFQKEIEDQNKNLKKYEEKEEYSLEVVSLSEGELTRELIVAKIRDNQGRVRPVIVKGKFKGVFLDQIVSNLGQMLETEYYYVQKDATVESISNTNNVLLEEPFITLNENSLVLHLPLRATKEMEFAAKIAKRIDKRSFEILPDQYFLLRENLGSVILDKKAKNYLLKFIELEDKEKYLKALDSFRDYSIDKIGGFKPNTLDLSLNEKTVLSWIEKNPRGIIGINKQTHKLLLGLALKNPKENYLLISKEKGNLYKEVNNSLSILPTNIVEIVPEELKKAKLSKYSKLFFNDVYPEINHPSKYFLTSVFIAQRIEKLYEVNSLINNQEFTEEEKNQWCSIYSHTVSSSYIGLKKEKKEEFLEWMRTHTLICDPKDLTFENVLGIEKPKENLIEITSLDPSIETLYTTISKKLNFLISTNDLRPEVFNEKIEMLHLLLNNPKKALVAMGHGDIKVTNKKVTKALEIAINKIGNNKNVIFFSEDPEVGEEMAREISSKTPGVHLFLSKENYQFFKNGQSLINKPIKELRHKVDFKSVSGSHYQIKDLEIGEYEYGIHLDRGFYSVKVLEERDKLVKDNIYVDAVSSNPTLDKVFSMLSASQVKEIKNAFVKERPKYVFINSNQEALSINKDLLEATVSAHPSIYSHIQNKILLGKKSPLVYLANLDSSRYTKLEENNSHLIAKVKTISEPLNVPHTDIIDVTGLSLFYNPITKPIASDSSVITEKKGNITEITITQKHPMLGYYNKQTLNAVIRTVKVKRGKIISVENDLFTTAPCTPNGIATKAIFSQYKLALKHNIPAITTFGAGGPESFDSKGKSKPESLIGYYVWGKLGYDTNILTNKGLRQGQREKILFSLDTPKWSPVKEWLLKHTNFSVSKNILQLSDVYACVIGGKLMGQEWWKVNGAQLYLELSTDPKSISFRVINRYFKKKCQEEGVSEEDYFDVPSPPFNVNSLSCWNEIMKTGKFVGVSINNIKETLKLYTNNLIKSLIRETSDYPYSNNLKTFLLLILKSEDTPIKKEIVQVIPEIVLKGIYQKLYKEEKKNPSSDPLLHSIFTDITKGKIKISNELSSDNTDFLSELANDPLLEEEWKSIGLDIESKTLKEEILENDPMLKKKVK